MSSSDPRADPQPGVSPEVVALPGAAAATNGNGNGAVASASGSAPAPSTESSATCADCGAPLAPDQRYCLACGQPASPVRLAFLDVLQGEYQPSAFGADGVPGGPPSAVGYYAPPPEPDGLVGALRRYSGLLALTGVLLAALLIGLLVGHWITGGNSTAPSPASRSSKSRVSADSPPRPAADRPPAGAAPARAHPARAPNPRTARPPKATVLSRKKPKKPEAAAKAPPAVHKKTSSQSLQKLDKTTGKQHAKEVNKLIKGDEPIETQ